MRRAVSAAVLLVLPVVVVVGFFLSLATVEDGVPTGRDTAFYLWRAKVVAAEGLAALPDAVPPPFRSQPFRSGHPLLAGFLDTVAGSHRSTWPSSSRP